MGSLAWTSQWKGLLYFLTQALHDKQLRECPPINLTSPYSWDPMKVCFPEWSQSLEEYLGGVRYIGAVVSSHLEENYDERYIIFNWNKMSRKIVSVKVTKEVPVLVRNEERDIGNLDIYISIPSRPQSATQISPHIIWVSNGS